MGVRTHVYHTSSRGVKASLITIRYIGRNSEQKFLAFCLDEEVGVWLNIYINQGGNRPRRYKE